MGWNSTIFTITILEVTVSDIGSEIGELHPILRVFVAIFPFCVTSSPLLLYFGGLFATFDWVQFHNLGLPTKFESHLNSYKKQLNHHSMLLKTAKRNLISEKLMSCGKDSKRLWQEINGALHRSALKTLSDHSCPLELADNFITFFNEKVMKLGNSFQPECVSDPPVSDTVSCGKPRFCQIQLVNEKELIRTIMNSPSKLSP